MAHIPRTVAPADLQINPQLEWDEFVNLSSVDLLTAYPLPEPVDFDWSASSAPGASSKSRRTSKTSIASRSRPRLISESSSASSSSTYSSSSSIIAPVVKAEPRPERRCRSQRARNQSSRDADEVASRFKTAHSVVERRYRDKLNDKMLQLHQTLAASEWSTRGTEGSISPSILSSESSDKFNKAEVMAKAIDYVNQTEVQMRHMTDEIEQLQSRLQHLETRVQCGNCSLAREASSEMLSY